mgnify:CR=1 FL=1
MPIGIFGSAASSNTIAQVDDPTVWTDEGSAMPTPYWVTSDVDQGPAGGTSRLRALVQALTIAGATSIRVTPIADGAEVTDQAETFALVTGDGSEQRLEHMVASSATRHAMKVEVTSFGAGVTFGEGELLLVPRRSTERA